MEFINQYWPLLVPLILVQLGLMIYCLVDLSRREQVKGPKVAVGNFHCLW